MKYLFLLFIFFAGISPVKAQDKNQFSVNYGLYTAPQYLGDFVDNFLAPVITLGLVRERSTTTYKGVPYFSWAHHVNKQFSYGADFIADRFERQVYDYETGEKYAHYNYAFYSFLAHADFNFIHTEHVRLYTNLGMGLGFVHRTESAADQVLITKQSAFAFNFTPLGFSYKSGKHFCWNAETNFGNKPVIAAGVGYSF